MNTRHVSLLFVGLVALSLLTGCRSSRSGSASLPSAPDSEAALADRASAHAHYAQGIIEEYAGRTTNALESFHQAALLDPGNEELVVEVSRRWLLQKQPERALEVLKRGTEQPDASAMLDVLLGTSYAALGKTNLAQQASQRAIRKAPKLLAGHQNLYSTCYNTGRTNEALKVLDDAAKVKGADAEFLVGLAELYVAHGTAQQSVKSNATARALGLLERADSLNSTNVPTRIRLADGFNLLGKPDKAAAMYQRLLEDYPQAPMLQESLRAKLTDIYLRGKDRKRAIEQLEIITRDDPMNAQAHYYLALLSSEEGDAARAETHYRRTIVLNPKFEQAYYDLAMAQLATGKTNEVFTTLAAAQKKFGENFISEFLLGIANVRIGKFDESVKRFTSAEVIARASDAKRLTPQFYYHFGAALERKGDYSESVKYLEKALEAKPDFAEAANHLGYMWAERGENLERARELIERAVKAEPKNSAYLDSLAWVLFKLGKAQEALPYMKQAIAIAEAEQEFDAVLYDHLGDIHAALGEREAAMAAWRKALANQPEDPAAIRKKLETNH
jgi:tetratricopeptide (TPR) repeat protein